jgi:hypothetical protein
MSHTILLFCGTTPGAAGMDLLRRIQAERSRLESLQSLSTLLKQRLALLNNIQTVAIDVDATHIYPCNLPAHCSIHQWQPGDFLHCPMPNPDLIRSIQLGRQPERYENFNPHALRALQTKTHASGGTRPNGYIGFQVNRQRIEQKLRQCLRNPLLQQAAGAMPEGEPVRVILVASTFGGFSSGSLELLKQLVWQVADEIKIGIHFSCILLIPGGMHLSKDGSNSRAVTLAVMKELAATSTGQHYQWQAGVGTGGAEAIRQVETVLVSDTNHAPEAQGLSVPNLVSLVAELLLTLATTPLGVRLITQAADFTARAGETTIAGEPRSASSVGMSVIYLGRKRLTQFGECSLGQAVVSCWLQPANGAIAQQSAQDFVVRHRLLAGQGERQLLERLLEEAIVDGNPITPLRVAGLIDHYTQNYQGMDLLTQAETQARLAFQQAIQPANTLQDILVERQTELVRGCVLDLQQTVEASILNPNQGVLTAKQFLSTLLQLLEAIAVQASEDTPKYDSEVSHCQTWLTTLQTQTVPYLQQQFQRERNSWLYPFRSRRVEARLANQSQEAGWRYLNGIKRYYRALMQQTAHHTGVETLLHLFKHVRHLLQQVQQVEASLTALHSRLQNERSQIMAYSPEFECPNGLYLIKTAAELQLYYQRILPEGSEDRAIATISNDLSRQSALLSLLSDPNQLREHLATQAGAILNHGLAGLHIVTELNRRFSNGQGKVDEKALGEALRQRDRQSYEFIQLGGNSDTEHGVFVIRLLGIDQTKAGNLPILLNQYASQRGMSYEVLNTEDPDKILFLQYRAVFAYSDWAHFGQAWQDYEQVSRATRFEKFHPVVGARNLPLPGQMPTLLQAKVALIDAWILGKLHPHVSGSSSYQLQSGEEWICLKNLEPEVIQTVLCKREGYRHLVYLTSQFNCLYLERGPQFCYEKLHHLLAVPNGTGTRLSPVESVLATFEDAITELFRQLDWWQNNTITLHS